MLRSDLRELRNSKVKLGWWWWVVVGGGWWVYRANAKTGRYEMEMEI